MGSESVDLVRRVDLAWQEGDVEELLSFVDPEATWSPVLRFLEGEGAAVGHQGLRRWFATFEITYRTFRPMPGRFKEHGSRVLVLGRLVGASRLGEGDLAVAVAWVWTVRAGRIVAMEAFLEQRAARDGIASR